METPEYELVSLGLDCLLQEPESPKDFKIVSHQELTSLDKQDKAVRIIQRAWRRFLDISVFQHLKKIINIRRQGDPHQIMRYINPKEADLIDAAAGIIVRFRFAGVKFPPHICYKIFTHRHIEDLCANSPRDYTKLPPKHTSHCKSNNIQEDDESGWYHRTENNGWRPVSDTFWTTENVTLGDKKEIKFQFSKLMKRKDVEKRRKIRKIEWMRQMYYAGSLEAKSTNHETLGLIHTATKGLIRAIEDGGIDSVMEWEVDEILNWTNTLNFDEYIATWKEIATSNSSDNFKGFSFGQTEEKTYENEMEASDGYANAYVRPCFPKLTPESVYDCKI